MKNTDYESKNSNGIPVYKWVLAGISVVVIAVYGVFAASGHIDFNIKKGAEPETTTAAIAQNGCVEVTSENPEDDYDSGFVSNDNPGFGNGNGIGIGNSSNTSKRRDNSTKQSQQTAGKKTTTKRTTVVIQKSTPTLTTSKTRDPSETKDANPKPPQQEQGQQGPQDQQDQQDQQSPQEQQGQQKQQGQQAGKKTILPWGKK